MSRTRIIIDIHADSSACWMFAEYIYDLMTDCGDFAAETSVRVINLDFVDDKDDEK